MPDRPDVQVGIEGAEGPFHLDQGLVGGGHLAGVQVTGADAGAHHVDAVEPCLGGDGILVAGVGEAVLADLGISSATIYRWLRDGFVAGEQLTPGAPWQIRIDQQLRDRVRPRPPTAGCPSARPPPASASPARPC